MATLVDMAGQSCGNTSADTWSNHESSHNVGDIDMARLAQFQATLLVLWWHVLTCCWHFQLRWPLQVPINKLIPMVYPLNFLSGFLSRGILLRHRFTSSSGVLWSINHSIASNGFFYIMQVLSKVNLRLHKTPKSQDHALNMHRHKTAHRNWTTTRHSPIIIHKHTATQKHGSMIWHSLNYGHYFNTACAIQSHKKTTCNRQRLSWSSPWCELWPQEYKLHERAKDQDITEYQLHIKMMWSQNFLTTSHGGAWRVNKSTTLQTNC